MALPTLPSGKKKRNTIIVFANQKGGVGKTSICTTYANYLSALNVPVLVIDADNQRSIYKKRKEDRKAFPDEPIPYNVETVELSNYDNAVELMERARLVEGTVLIDCPGSLTEEGLVPVLTQCDYIVCPFQFDKVTNMSTSDFIIFVNNICRRFGIDPPQFIFVPNRFNKNWGKKGELDVWRELEDSMKELGIVTSRIPSSADMTRYNTYINTPKLNDVLKNPYGDILRATEGKTAD